MNKKHKKWIRWICPILIGLLLVIIVPRLDFNEIQMSIKALRLTSRLQDVTQSVGYRYHTTDDTGVEMDTAKIIESPMGGYLAVYHHNIQGNFFVRLALSFDLLHWKYVMSLEKDASQPTIVQLWDGGFVVGFEKHTDLRGQLFSSHLVFVYYKDLDALKAGKETKRIDLPRTLAWNNEGTPNIYSVHTNPDLGHSTLVIGFHYSVFWRDRIGIGTLTNFNPGQWITRSDEVNDLFQKETTVQGNVGDRDSFYFQQSPFSLIEGQSNFNDFASWEPYLYDRVFHKIMLLSLHTHRGGKAAFANPTYTELNLPDGRRGFVSTQYVFAPLWNPERGVLIYYNVLG
jgi:hypothetical protein